MSTITFVIGGARSGKSAYAAKLACDIAGDRTVVYIATATANDDEMAKRIARHRNERPANWRTIEEPYDVGAAIWSGPAACPVVLIDCLTLLVTNHMLLYSECDEASMIEGNIEQVVAEMIVAAKEATAEVIVVSNEVGLSIVPEYPLARLFRDVAGRANQRLAAAADRVVFMVAGIPMVIKGK